MNFKNFLNSFRKGIKHGLSIQILPKKYEYILNLVAVRILRVLGGICMVYVLLKSRGLNIIEIPDYLYSIVYFLAILQGIQIVVTGLTKLVFGLIKLFKNKQEFEVRNSPLDRSATLIAKLMYCYRVGCQAGQSVVGIAGTGVIIDTILEAGGKEPVFTPIIGTLIPGRNSELKTSFNDQKKKLSAFNSAVERYQQATQIQQATHETLEKAGVSMTAEEKKDISSTVNELVKLENKNLKDAANRLKEAIDKATGKK